MKNIILSGNKFGVIIFNVFWIIIVLLLILNDSGVESLIVVVDNVFIINIFRIEVLLIILLIILFDRIFLIEFLFKEYFKWNK